MAEMSSVVVSFTAMRGLALLRLLAAEKVYNRFTNIPHLISNMAASALPVRGF